MRTDVWSCGFPRRPYPIKPSMITSGAEGGSRETSTWACSKVSSWRRPASVRSDRGRSSTTVTSAPRFARCRAAASAPPPLLPPPASTTTRRLGRSSKKVQATSESLIAAFSIIWRSDRPDSMAIRSISRIRSAETEATVSLGTTGQVPFSDASEPSALSRSGNDGFVSCWGERCIQIRYWLGLSRRPLAPTVLSADPPAAVASTGRALRCPRRRMHDNRPPRTSPAATPANLGSNLRFWSEGVVQIWADPAQRPPASFPY